jgi:hypothetical protein
MTPPNIEVSKAVMAEKCNAHMPSEPEFLVMKMKG